MKFSNIKTVLALSVGSAAVITVAACSGGLLPEESEADTAPVSVAAGPLETKEVLFTVNATDQETAPAPIEAGTLVKGSSSPVYYVADTGTLRSIPDDETFAAFGFSSQEVIEVDDDVLSTIPVDDALTRLLVDDDNNLYWVAKGQRWQINEWKGIVQEVEHPDLTTSRLDSSLQDRLGTRYTFNGTLLRQGELVYYSMNRSLTRVTSDNFDEAQVINVPSGVLAAYPQQLHLKLAWTRLGALTQAANVRTEPVPSIQIPTCHAQPIRGFGTVWQNHPEVRQWLGCPFTNFRRNEHATRAAVQTFQHGWMLWLETDTVANVDPIYVFFEDNDSYIRYGDRELVDAHSYALTPQGFYKVGDRFAKVYWEEIGARGRQRLGYAINEARDSQGAFQEFQNGRMFWAGEADTIYIIYQGNFDFDGDGIPTWTQGWTSYEDTFEDPLED